MNKRRMIVLIAAGYALNVTLILRTTLAQSRDGLSGRGQF
jgi:hypothetical protein